MDLYDAQALVPGSKYEFKIRDWETPFGEVILGQKKERAFIGVEVRGATIGDPGIPFIRVSREDGTSHLIAIETIEAYGVLHAIQ